MLCRGEKFKYFIQIFMFLVCLGYQVSYLVMASTLIPNVVRDIITFSGGNPSDSVWTDPNISFRYYEIFIEFLIVFPVSCL